MMWLMLADATSPLSRRQARVTDGVHCAGASGCLQSDVWWPRLPQRKHRGNWPSRAPPRTSLPPCVASTPRAVSCRGVNACLSPQCLRGSRLNATGGGAVKTALGWCRRLSVLLLLLLRLLLLLTGLEVMAGDLGQ